MLLSVCSADHDIGAFWCGPCRRVQLSSLAAHALLAVYAARALRVTNAFSSFACWAGCWEGMLVGMIGCALSKTLPSRFVHGRAHAQARGYLVTCMALQLAKGKVEVSGLSTDSLCIPCLMQGLCYRGMVVT